MPLHVVSKSSDEDLIIELSGDLDETVKFPQMKVRLSSRIIFNCRELGHMNSMGAQIWSKWMGGFDQRQQFVFREVPPRVIDMFNLVKGILPKESTIESFYVPYECNSCGNEENLLVIRGKDYVESMNGQKANLLFPTEINCSKCKNSMRLGVWESKFLRFLEAKEE